MSQFLLQNNILRICINKKKKNYTLNEFINDEILKDFGIDQILNTLQTLDLFFHVNKSNKKEILVNVSIILRACPTYVSYRRYCNGENCKKLHICESKLKNNLLECICPLNHCMKSAHNETVFRNFNVVADYMLILDFYQLFYNQTKISIDSTVSLSESFQSDSDKNHKSSIRINENLHDKKKIFFKNVPLSLRIDDISLLMSSLIKQKPISVDIITTKNNELAVYLLSFEKDLDIKKLESNINEFKKRKHLDNDMFLLELVFKDKIIENLNGFTNFSGPSSISSYKNIDLREVYLKNVPEAFESANLTKIINSLTGSIPFTFKIVNPENGSYLLKFDSDLDMKKFENNFISFKLCMPSPIEYEFAQKDLSVIIIPLDTNIFMKMILRDRNFIWKKELFGLLEKERVSVSYDEHNLIIKSNDSIFPKSELVWSMEIHTIINKFYDLFHFEMITYDETNFDNVVELIRQIDLFKSFCLIDYYYVLLIPNIWILGRRSHIECFFHLNNHLKYLSKLFTKNNNLDINNNCESIKNDQTLASSSNNKCDDRRKKRKVTTLKESYENMIKKR